jgi:GT2 family glycosyltransferase
MIQVSVIIPTYNRLEQLKLTLQWLEKQVFPLDQFEVIVISDGCDDGTNDYLLELKPPYCLTPLLQKNQGVAAARNNGVKAARGRLILFIDDDIAPDSYLILEHVAMHAKLGAGTVVLGPMLSPVDHEMQPWVHWEQNMLYKQYHSMETGEYAPTARQFFTGNTSLERRLIVEAGGFDPRFRRAEDVELAYRLSECGASFVFHPKAIGYHYAVRSFESWLAIPYAYGKSDVIFSQLKNQKWLVPTVLREYRTRHLMTRTLISLCLDRPWIYQWVQALLKNLMETSYRKGKIKITEWVCSSIFNLRYYQGFADEMGGRAVFFGRIRQQMKQMPAESV